jgi:type I restriction enzyme R subunit
VPSISRLNRIHPLKESTFVLDFRNDTEDIVEAFEQLHGVTVAPRPTPTSCGTPAGCSTISMC